MTEPASPAEVAGEPANVLEILEARVGTELRGASWLSERLLLMVFHTTGFREWDVEITVRLEGHDNALLSRCLRYPVDGVDNREGRALLVVLPDRASPGAADRILVHVSSWRRSITIEPEQLSARLLDVRAMLREELADLPVDVRLQLMALLADSSQWHSAGGGGVGLSQALRLVRDGLREPRPLAVSSPDVPRGLSVDSLLALDDRSFWIKGWHRDVDSVSSKLLVVSPEGMTFDLLPGAYVHDRPDVRALYGTAHSRGDEKSGFLHYFRLPAPSPSGDGWLCELHSQLGHVVEARAPIVTRDPIEVRNRILAEFAQAEDLHFLARNHAHPALSEMREREVAEAGIDRSRIYGSLPAEPTVSVILPLYRRLDLLEHQFAQFVHDPEISETEIVLVLDSLEQRDAMEARARILHDLYGIPFRLIYLKQNSGVSVAFNQGANVARGRLLCLMHSDVLPGGPGWLSELVTHHDRLENPGAVGPRLLYDDGIVQSAGLFFREVDDTQGWEVAHLLRGMHGGFPRARESRPVAAVSSACLLVERERFQGIGGLRTDFVQGGYEDVDLCLRLDQSGRENWLVGSAALFHLEGYSYPDQLKAMANRYNRWLHNRSWGEHMEALRVRYPVTGVAPARSTQSEESS